MAEDRQSPPGKRHYATEDGGRIQPLYAERKVKVYSVQESELKHISGLNVMAMASFSVAAAFFGFAASIWLELAFGDPVAEVGKLIAKYGPPLLLVISFCAFVFGCIAIKTRGSILKTIKDESVLVWPPGNT